MSRINAVNPDTATGKAKELLGAVNTKMGMTPNMMKTMAQSPAVLDAYLKFSDALSHGALNAKTREQIALVSATENHCGYCASAHTAIGKMVGLSEDAISSALEGSSTDAKTDAALKFAQIIIANRGEVTDADLQTIKTAGHTDGEIAEIVANVALNVFTNDFNEIAQTEIDFPKVQLKTKAA